MSHNDFDKRMKQYESVYNQKIIPHIPIILRIDGHNFHNFTKQCKRPFDNKLSRAFQIATMGLGRVLGKFNIAYGQSDEVSIFIYNPNTMSQEYYDGKIFKFCSLVASSFTADFNNFYESGSSATFDCRIFQLPVSEVTNYFIWRQKDAVRNSIQMLGRANFSHNQLNNKSCSNIQDMLMEKGINWDSTETKFKRGWCVDNSGTDEEIPIFTQDRDFIERFLEYDELDDKIKEVLKGEENV